MVTLSIDELTKRMRSLVDAFVSEMKRDDQITNFKDDIGLSAVGYPSFEVLLANHTDFLAQILCDFMSPEVTQALFSHDSGPQTRAIVHGLKSCAFDADEVTFKMMVIEIAPKVEEK